MLFKALAAAGLAAAGAALVTRTTAFAATAPIAPAALIITTGTTAVARTALAATRATALVLALDTTTATAVLVLAATAMRLALELLGTTLGTVTARGLLDGGSTAALLGSHLAGHALHSLVHASLNALAHAGLPAALGTARTLAVAAALVATAVGTTGHIAVIVAVALAVATRLLELLLALGLAALGLLLHLKGGRVALGVNRGRVGTHMQVAGLVDVGGLVHEFLDLVELVHVLLGHKRDGPAQLAGAARTANTVDVVGRLGRHVKVHDVAHIADVDAAGKHVGRHQHVDGAITEGRKRALTLGLAAVAVNRGGLDALALQTTAAAVGAVLGAHKDDGALRALLFEELGQQVVLGLDGHREHKLIDGIGGRRSGRDLHAGRIAHQVGDLAHGLLVERRREQQRLALGRRLAHNAADGGQKAHVEHAVGLVEHQHLDLVQVAGALLDQIDQTARRGDQDVAAVLEGSGLGLVAHAAHDGHGNMAGDVGDLARDLVDLLGELARGGDNEHHRATAVALGLLGAATAVAAAALTHRLGRSDVLQIVHGRQQEGGRLAGAGLGGGKQVAAFEHHRDRAGLHGRRRRVAQVLDGTKHLVGKAQLVKGGQALGSGLDGLGSIGLIGGIEGSLGHGLAGLVQDLGVGDVGYRITHMLLFLICTRNGHGMRPRGRAW